MRASKVLNTIAKLNSVPLLCALLLSVNTACASSRIGGTYVAHGERFVEILQLTESQDGQITGVLNTMELKNDGSIDTDEASITSGTIDGDQLTLHISELAVFGENIAGTVSGSTIRLQSTGKDGSVLTWEFQRASLEEFKTYADRLKSEGAAIVLNSKLMSSAQEVRQTVLNAEAWISNSEVHAQRISAVRDYYQKLENRMRSLIAQERATPNSVARTQISVAVIQVDVTGTQSDVQVSQLWDQTIVNSGQSLIKQFANYPSNCFTLTELQGRGATLQNAEEWQNACQQMLIERMKFEPAFDSIIGQRADLKSFQAAAKSRRQAIVDEASRLQ
ncbi:MAG: hypothetical protein ABSA54_19795 [Terriglobales bacterium]|jgi:hypothetical protein